MPPSGASNWPAAESPLQVEIEGQLTTSQESHLAANLGVSRLATPHRAGHRAGIGASRNLQSLEGRGQQLHALAMRQAAFLVSCSSLRTAHARPARTAAGRAAGRAGQERMSADYRATAHSAQAMLEFFLPVLWQDLRDSCTPISRGLDYASLSSGYSPPLKAFLGGRSFSCSRREPGKAEPMQTIARGGGLTWI